MRTTTDIKANFTNAGSLRRGDIIDASFSPYGAVPAEVLAVDADGTRVALALRTLDGAVDPFLARVVPVTAGVRLFRPDEVSR